MKSVGGLAEFALANNYLTKDAPALPKEDERSLCELFNTHGGPLSARAEGIADRFA